ncbi:hypothetical protein Ancab_014015 [Ancistrocladus abbreviatus]
MEGPKITRKRRRSSETTSLNPFEGTFTRTKSQIYCHLNRSGQSRSDTVRRSHHDVDIHSYLPARRRARSSNIRDDCNGKHEISHVSVKDLRAHRVFSQPLDDQNAIERFGPEGEREEVLCGKADSGIDWEKGKLNIEERNPNLVMLKVRSPEGKDDEIDEGEGLGLSPSLCESKQRSNANCEDLGEEHIQTTPPDDSLRTEDRPMVTPLSENGPRNNCLVKEGCESNSYRKNDSDSNRKMILNPCARLKVFRASSSFSYRRLLPFLTAIANTTSCAAEINPSPKIETCSEEKTSKQALVSSSQGSFEEKLNVNEITQPITRTSMETTEDICKKENVSSEHCLNDSSTHHSSIQAPIDRSSSDNQCNSVSSESQIGTQMANGSSEGAASQVERVLSDKPENLDPGLKNASPIAGSDQIGVKFPPAKASEVPSRDFILKVPFASSDCAGGKCSRTELEFRMVQKTIGGFERSSILEAVPSEVPRVGLGKGILKRNPRGCRGLCTCLDCASFRLHAERAFEFSRNQMQDAEELTLYLVKELSQLRSILEKSVDNTNADAIFPATQVNDAY